MSFRRSANAQHAKINWREHRSALRDELRRFHELPDRFMARALRDFGRNLIEEIQEGPDAWRIEKDEYGNIKDGYTFLIVAAIIPALAMRLGEKSMTPDERISADHVPTDPAELRNLVGTALSNFGLRGRRGVRLPIAARDLITADFVNGNVVAIATDRVAPPGPDSSDWLARHMREISVARFGDDRFSAWSPEFQNYPSRSRNLESAMESILSEVMVEADEEDGFDADECTILPGPGF